ncbi:MAG: hypothetical protein IT285_09715 [Bdellovibrionales bacterium]|nr:hypothetical protein [Bdellovibrionales bacterium]
MRGWAPRAAFALVVVFLVSPRPSAADESITSKISLRTANGLLLNQGTGGSTFSIGGLNVSYAYHVKPTVAFGLAYEADFDFERSTTPLSGFSLFWRWYLRGSGVPDSAEGIQMGSVTRELFSIYTGIDVARKEYFLGSNPLDAPTLEQTGSFVSLNALVGADSPITDSIEFNVELNGSLLTFAGSDNRFFVRSYMLIFGLSYVW